MDFINSFVDAVGGMLTTSGYAEIFTNFSEQWGRLVMILLSCLLFYLAIKKGFEPLLLIPIGFGMLMVNIAPSLLNPPTDGEAGGLIWYFQQGIQLELFPPLIFLGIGAMTDFGPLLSRPSSLWLGAAAQFGVFGAFMVAIFLFNPQGAASIAIIGGADGPTSIFLTNKLAPEMLAPIAVAAYSYMALVPVIQPPICKLLTTKKERMIKMEMGRSVSKLEKIAFPIICFVAITLLLPSVAPLIGMLMLGNLFKECGVVDRLSDTAQNALINIVTIFLGLSVGAKATASAFINLQFIEILALGLMAFAFATAMGVLIGKIMCKATGGKINPLIGAAGVSAVPMAARVVNKVGQEEDPSNFLLMHAMGPNVAGVIGSAVAAGVLLTLFG